MSLRNIVLLGAPLTGKGTQGRIISEKFGIPHISSGDMYRQLVSEGNPIALEAKKVVERGELFSDELAIKILKERLSKNDCENGYILDGVPRTLNQAVIIDEMEDVDITYAIFIDTPDNVLIKRAKTRTMCCNCKRSYGKEISPEKEGICECGGELQQRKDDREEIVIKRLETYMRQTEPLIAFYSEKGLLTIIDGDQKPDEVTSDLIAALRDYNDIGQ